MILGVLLESLTGKVILDSDNPSFLFGRLFLIYLGAVLKCS